MSHALLGGCSHAGMFAYIVGSPRVFIELYGVPAQYYGLLFGANAAVMIAGAYGQRPPAAALLSPDPAGPRPGPAGAVQFDPRWRWPPAARSRSGC